MRILVALAAAMACAVAPAVAQTPGGTPITIINLANQVAAILGPTFGCTNNCTFTGTTTANGTLTLAPTTGNNPTLLTSTANGGTGAFFINNPASSGQTTFLNGGKTSLSLTSGAVAAKQQLTFDTSGYNPLTTSVIREVLNLSGTQASNVTMNTLNMATDTANIGASQNLTVFNVTDFFGGSAMTGQRNVLAVNAALTAKSGNGLPGGTSFSATQIESSGAVNDGGTDLTNPVTATAGAVWGENVVASLKCAVPGDPTQCATFYTELSGIEYDIVSETGTSLVDKFGIKISLSANDAVQGSRSDIGLAIATGRGHPTSLGWKTEIGFGSYPGYWPGCNNPGCTLIYGQDHLGAAFTQYDGIILNNGTFTHNSWDDGHVQMTGAGDLLANSAVTLSASATAGFLHLPHTSAAPTGTPTNTTGPACEWNTATHVLNCFDGTQWYHFTATAGAG